MKKVLAFVLVLAMVLGSVSMAFATTYSDDAAITNKEAVGVLSGLKVLEGDANGFRPNDTLTRAEAAAIVARLLLGRDDADKLTASAALFTDVPATHWAAGYIAYCVSQGIIAGNGDGTFTPDGVLTVSAFGKMLLCALGYDAQTEGLVGSNWEANTAALMVKANIAVSATGACTRDTAALLGLKTLEADCVEYLTKGVTVNTGAAQVTVGGSSATKITAPAGTSYDGSADTNLQLAEKVYKDKIIKTTTNTNDDFLNPATEWRLTDSVAGKYVGTIGDFSKKAVATFTGKMTAAQVNDALNGYQIEVDGTLKTINNTTKVPAAATMGAVLTGNNINGGAVTTPAGTQLYTNNTLAKNIADFTDDGQVVELFATSGKITNIVIRKFAQTKVSSVTASTNKTTYTLAASGAFAQATGYVYNDDTENTIIFSGSLAKDDVVTVYKAPNNKLYVYPTTKVSGSQTAYSTGGTHETVTLDGTVYTVGKAVVGYTSDALASTADTATLYIDQFGFAVKSSATESTDYAFVLQAGVGSKTVSALGTYSPNPQVKVVLADGTVATYSMVTKTSNKDIFLQGYSTANLTTGAGASYAAINEAVVKDLEGRVVTYSMSDGKIKVTGILADSTEAATGIVTGLSGTTYAAVSSTRFVLNATNVGGNAIPAAAVKAGETKFDDGATSVIANASTNFVVFRSDKETAATYASMPKIAAGKNTADVVVYKSGTVNTGVTAFVVVNGTVSDKSTNYAYIKGTATATISKSGDNTIYSYDAYDKDGAKITITHKDSELTKATVYAISADNEAVDLLVAESTKGTAQFVANVSDNIVKVSGTAIYYNMTDATQIAYVDADASYYNNHTVVVVLNDATDHTDEILTMYVISADPE